MKHYVTTRHPITGQSIACIPTGAKRAENGGRKEIEVRVITPKTNLETLWLKREDLTK